MDDREFRGQPVDSFVNATVVALAEMAGTEVAVREVYQSTLGAPWCDISAVLEIKSATEGLLVLGFPERTAAAIAERVLAGVQEEINETLVRDCIGEVANVIAGQAKTLLAGTPHQFTYSLPQVVVGKPPPSNLEWSHSCIVIVFVSELGEFTMHLALARANGVPR